MHHHSHPLFVQNLGIVPYISVIECTYFLYTVYCTIPEALIKAFMVRTLLLECNLLRVTDYEPEKPAIAEVFLGGRFEDNQRRSFHTEGSEPQNKITH